MGFLILIGKPSFSQLDNTAFENRIPADSSATGELHFNLYNFNFLRNYEYTNYFHDGYTLYGTQLRPQFVYYAHPNLVLTAGAYLRKDFGSNGLADAKPLFSIRYQKKDLSLLFGSLEGATQHRFIEPLYDIERQITDPIEYGSQLILNKKYFRLDAWLSWQHMISNHAPEKEQILGGVSTETTLISAHGWTLSLPLQFLAMHKGGQIDDLRGVPIATLGNGAAGFKLSRDLGGAVKNIFTENYFAGFRDFSPDKRQAFKGGFGLWFNAGVNTRFGSFVTSYWHGNNFMSLKGMPLYESVSHNVFKDGYIENKRNILSLRYVYQKELLPHFYLDVRFEPHFDLDRKDSQLQFNHSLFLTYKHDFRIGKI